MGDGAGTDTVLSEKRALPAFCFLGMLRVEAGLLLGPDFVRVSTAVMKHHDHKQLGEERACFTYISI